MEEKRFSLYSAVYVTLIDENQRVFLLRRANTGYFEGHFAMPAGHIEDDETPMGCAIRELKEEIGVDVTPDNLTFARNSYRICSDRTYSDYFFTCTSWEGTPHNAEPEKASEAQWFSLNDLPSDLIPSQAYILGLIRDGITFSEIRETLAA